MIILENKFSPVAINIPLADIGIDTKKVLDTTDELGGGIIANTLYLPFKDNDKFLSLINDIVIEVASANCYDCYPYMTIEETDESFPNVFPIPYNISLDLEYSPNGEVILQVWIEPKNPEDKQYLDESLSCECFPVELDDDDKTYLLNVLTEIVWNRWNRE